MNSKHYVQRLKIFKTFTDGPAVHRSGCNQINKIVKIFGDSVKQPRKFHFSFVSHYEAVNTDLDQTDGWMEIFYFNYW